MNWNWEWKNYKNEDMSTTSPSLLRYAMRILCCYLLKFYTTKTGLDKTNPFPCILRPVHCGLRINCRETEEGRDLQRQQNGVG